MKIEVTGKIEPDEHQKKLFKSHGFLNVITILSAELANIREITGQPDALQGPEQIIARIKKTLSELHPWLITPHQIQEFHNYMEQELAASAAATDWASHDRSLFDQSADNIRSLFRILHNQVRIMSKYSDDIRHQEPIDLEQIRRYIMDFLQAIEKNSKGGYRIVTDAREQGTSDYLFSLSMQSHEGDFVTMPAMLLECLFDLIANARKYTRPGGSIHTTLSGSPQFLTLLVQDNGMGIPGKELEQVTSFGHRAENARKRPTSGGGFGLTKAWYVTQKLNGRMWIHSEPGKGTAITLEIPREQDPN